MIRMIGDHSYNPKGTYFFILDDSQYVGSPNCFVYDARNYIAALGNKISGKGYESTENYKNIEI